MTHSSHSSFRLGLPLAIGCLLLAHFGCGGSPSASAPGFTGGTAGASGSCGNSPPPSLVINEVSSNNDGNAVDDQGNADDWLELVNTGSSAAVLGEVTLEVGGSRAKLPEVTLPPGGRIVLWADGDVAQGPIHLPVKLKASGTSLALSRCDTRITQIVIPALDTNQVYARFPDVAGDMALCRYATPNKSNGATCGPPSPPPLVDDYHFASFNWTLATPATTSSPLVIDELALRPASFIELHNVSKDAVDLSSYRLRVAPLRPGQLWPDVTAGTALPVGDGQLAPDQRLAIPVSEADVNAIGASSQFEGVATLFLADGSVADRVDFASWPAGAALARTEAFPGRLVFCSPVSPGEPNDACQLLAEREVGGYVRYLRTAADFERLAAGGGELGMASVKFILDMAAGGQVYLVGWHDWSLHYEFIREVIDGQPTLNRCDSRERSLFDAGWYNFSVTEYFQTIGRRYLLGTLVHHAATDLYTVEFALGDAILPEDMRKAFFAATAHVLNQQQYYLRPQDSDQTARAQTLDGTLPIVGPKAPFTATKLQPLTAAVGFGVLTYLPAAALETASLGQDVIVVTDDVPNDIPLVGGLITEAFQTPLSHVNVLCQNRGTPNLALPNAHALADFTTLLGQLVRFEVTADGYHLDAASVEEAQSYWNAHRGSPTSIAPRLDDTRTGFINLRQAGLDDLPSIGAKAAQLAELVKIAASYRPDCPDAVGFVTPDPAFALPVSYFLAHLQSSGARQQLESLLADSEASANRNLRHERLGQIRNAITTSPVDPQLLQQLTQLIKDNYGSTRVRMRSSSNAEDLPGFNGAGLYSSVSASVDDPDYPIANALREVWASLYSNRGYDERLLMNVDQLKVAMAILIHPAFPEERANAVVISRDMADVTRGDIYTFNVQLGEAAVTNPAPGVTSDQFTYQWPPRLPALNLTSISSFADGVPILSSREIVSAACAMRAVVRHFQPLLDPTAADLYFTMDMELKFVGANRQLLIKQARPYSFGSWQDPGDCRNF